MEEGLFTEHFHHFDVGCLKISFVGLNQKWTINFDPAEQVHGKDPALETSATKWLFVAEHFPGGQQREMKVLLCSEFTF